MTVRKCSTCKHYEPAPIWRKGWCRNPLLYAPQQSHLVSEDDLDCERGMGNYWEPDDTTSAESSEVEGVPVLGAAISRSADSRYRDREVMLSQSGQPIYQVSGSSGFSSEPYDDDVPGAGGGSAGTPPGRDRQLDYYSDDRYWTDYLRIALPILGVLLLLVLFWFWASSFFNDDDGDGQLGVGDSPTIPVMTAESTATQGALPTGTAQIVQTPSPPAASPTTATGVQTATTGTAPAGAIAPGATVVVANTGGTGVNLRTDATTTSDIVAVLMDGTQLTVTGESVESEGYIWWPVQSEAGEGYIVEDYLELAQ